MTRAKATVGMVFVGVLLVIGAPTAQEGARDECAGCTVTFRFGSGPEVSWLTATSADGTMLSKQISKSGLAVKLSAHGDIVDLTTNSGGAVMVGRQGFVITVKPDDVLADYSRDVAELLGESAAMRGLERMVQAVRFSKRPEAVSVLATFALLRSLQGDSTANALLAQGTQQLRAASLVRVAQSRDGTTVENCWAEYERTLSRNYDRYSRCLRDYWWAQPIQYACGLEFAMVAELALFNVIACSGGFPVGG